MPYEVQTSVFEGPFDLLLHLILQEQVDLYEVSLSTIVDAYLAELDRLDNLDLEVATEFVLIAATLVELKTRRLLPMDDDLDLDEELALWEERDLLLSRLLECKMFKDAAVVRPTLRPAAPRTSSSTWCPTCSPMSAPTICGRRSSGRRRPGPSCTSTSTTRRPSGCRSRSRSSS